VVGYFDFDRDDHIGLLEQEIDFRGTVRFPIKKWISFGG
jgi:hypothetical protein